jgi:FixJ family two-component response regulator
LTHLNHGGGSLWDGCSSRQVNALSPLIDIVDDDPSVRDSMKVMLETAGYDVRTFQDATAYFQREKLRPSNLIVLDVNLPGESGFQVLTRLRQQGVAVPAIFISGRASAEMRARANKAEALFFEKPVPPSDLLATINRLVG